MRGEWRTTRGNEVLRFSSSLHCMYECTRYMCEVGIGTTRHVWPLITAFTRWARVRNVINTSACEKHSLRRILEGRAGPRQDGSLLFGHVGVFHVKCLVSGVKAALVTTKHVMTARSAQTDLKSELQNLPPQRSEDTRELPVTSDASSPCFLHHFLWNIALHHLLLGHLFALCVIRCVWCRRQTPRPWESVERRRFLHGWPGSELRPVRSCSAEGGAGLLIQPGTPPERRRRRRTHNPTHPASDVTMWLWSHRDVKESQGDRCGNHWDKSPPVHSDS